MAFLRWRDRLAATGAAPTSTPELRKGETAVRASHRDAQRQRIWKKKAPLISWIRTISMDTKGVWAYKKEMRVSGVFDGTSSFLSTCRALHSALGRSAQNGVRLAGSLSNRTARTAYGEPEQTASLCDFWQEIESTSVRFLV